MSSWSFQLLRRFRYRFCYSLFSMIVGVLSFHSARYIWSSVAEAHPSIFNSMTLFARRSTPRNNVLSLILFSRILDRRSEVLLQICSETTARCGTCTNTSWHNESVRGEFTLQLIASLKYSCMRLTVPCISWYTCLSRLRYRPLWTEFSPPASLPYEFVLFPENFPCVGKTIEYNRIACIQCKLIRNLCTKSNQCLQIARTSIVEHTTWKLLRN